MTSSYTVRHTRAEREASREAPGVSPPALKCQRHAGWIGPGSTVATFAQRTRSSPPSAC